MINWKVKQNGALRAITGKRLSVLLAYKAHADSWGNAWPGTNSEKTGALNKTTGASHRAIVSARKWLVNHRALIILDRETIKKIYKRHGYTGPTPPDNARVYHITGMATKCQDPGCACAEFAQVKVCIFYTPASAKSAHEDSTILSNATMGVDLEAPKPEAAKKKPDPHHRPLFEEIALKWWQLPEGDGRDSAARRVGALVAQLRKDAPDFMPEDVTPFLRWYRRECSGASYPRDKIKAIEWVVKFKSQQKPVAQTATPTAPVYHHSTLEELRTRREESRDGR